MKPETVKLLGAIAAGLIAWGTAQAKIDRLEKDVIELKAIYATLSDMNTRLSRIEGAVGVRQ